MEYIEIAIRTSVTFLALLVLTRIMGRKEITQLTFFDYVCSIAFGSIAASTLLPRNVTIPLALTALTVWTVWILLFDVITLTNIRARKFIQDEPLMVIHNGKILEHNLKRGYYNINDLLKLLREKDIFDPTEIETALIETDGKISILKKAQYQPLTLQDINQNGQSPPHSGSIGQEIIINGCIVEENLSKLGMTPQQLHRYLAARGVTDISAVTVAAITPAGNIYIDLNDDKEPRDL